MAQGDGWVVCQVTRKRGYSSRKAAREATRKINHRLHVYQCSGCGLWHVAKRGD